MNAKTNPRAHGTQNARTRKARINVYAKRHIGRRLVPCLINANQLKRTSVHILPNCVMEYPTASARITQDTTAFVKVRGLVCSYIGVSRYFKLLGASHFRLIAQKNLIFDAV